MDLLITCFNFSYVMVCPFLIFFDPLLGFGAVWCVFDRWPLPGGCYAHIQRCTCQNRTGMPWNQDARDPSNTTGCLQGAGGTPWPEGKTAPRRMAGTGGFNPRWVPNVHCRRVAHGLWNDPQKKRKLFHSKTRSKILNSNSPNVTNQKLNNLGIVTVIALTNLPCLLAIRRLDRQKVKQCLAAEHGMCTIFMRGKLSKQYQSISKCIKKPSHIRRKFRSQTSDNMDRWKAETGRVREKRRVEERRSEKQKKEDPGARKGRKVAKHGFSNDLWPRKVEK